MNRHLAAAQRWLVALSFALAWFLPELMPAQSNGPCQIIYLVRDEKGELLDPALLESIAAAKGEEMKPGETFIKNADGTTTENVKCLKSRLDIGGKPLRLSELTLKYHGKTMRLSFQLQIVEERRVIDSVPFQESAFKLENGKWIAAK